MCEVKMIVKKGAEKNENFKDSDSWTCTIMYKKRQYTVPFYKGYGHKGAKPEVKEVLSALFSDASCFESARDFEEFASDMGYDPDSRKAENIYNQCGKIKEKLARLFQEDYEKYEELTRDC